MTFTTNPAPTASDALWARTLLAVSFGRKWEIVDLEWANKWGDTFCESAYACRPDFPHPAALLIDRHADGYTLVSADVLV